MNTPASNPEGHDRTEEELESLQSCVPGFITKMRTSVERTLAFSEEFDKLRVPLLTLLDDIENMRNDVYAALVGLLNFLRNQNEMANFMGAAILCKNHEECDPELSAVLQRLMALLKKLRKAKHYRTDEDDEFATDTLLLLRSTYPFGINILNPQFRPDFPTSVEANDVHCRLSMGNKTIRIKKNDANSSRILYRDWDGNACRHILEKNSAAMIGRNLLMSSLYEMRLSEYLHVPPDVDPGSSHFSRGGIMVVRKADPRGDRLYFFDRGSRNPIILEAMTDDRTETATYDPIVEMDVDDDGGTNFGYGKTDHGSSERSHPSSDSDSDLEDES